MAHLPDSFLDPKACTGNLPARLIETFKHLGVPYEADESRQWAASETTDQGVLLAAFEKARAYYQVDDKFNGPAHRNPKEEIGMGFTASLSDEDGKHYVVKWVFNRLRQLLWVQCMPTPDSMLRGFSTDWAILDDSELK